MSFVATSIAMSVATTAMSIRAQQIAAKTQAQVQRNATIQEQQRHLQELSAKRTKERQEMIASAQARQQVQKKAREARATARVSAGESGLQLTSISVQSLIDSITQSEANYAFSLTQQADFRKQDSSLFFTDAAMRTRSELLRINKPISQPNIAGSILEGAQAGMNTYSFGQDAGFTD
jgi:hypothetical protein